jgi:Tfp pilus assembly protein PilF
MKKTFTIILTLLTFVTFGQQMTFKEWEEQSKTNIRLLPKYGDVEKTEEQKQFDEEFIIETMKLEEFKGDRTTASNYLIQVGFNYLNRGDLKTAMYRFNQAYLLDTTNTEIYWGFGAIYMTLGVYENAKKQYEEGLLKNPESTHLLTDFGTYYMAKYYELQSLEENNALENLELAISNIVKSYTLDNKDQNTIYKLSICYWLKGDCENAWKYYDECRALGGQPITEDYTKDLKKKCKKKKEKTHHNKR